MMKSSKHIPSTYGPFIPTLPIVEGLKLEDPVVLKSTWPWTEIWVEKMQNSLSDITSGT